MEPLSRPVSRGMTIFSRRMALACNVGTAKREGKILAFHSCPKGVYLVRMDDGRIVKVKGLSAAEILLSSFVPTAKG